MRTVQLAILALCLAAPVAAKPLITNSEETWREYVWPQKKARID